MLHVEFLVEDASGARLLDALLPKILVNRDVTWRLHPYRGLGHIPKDMAGHTDPSLRLLLDRLPALLRGYAKTPGIDAVVVLVDSDDRDCRVFLDQLQRLARCAAPRLTVLIRLAIEEIEAWYMGDREALLAAYPRAKRAVLDRYVQDSQQGTWELLADAVYSGGYRDCLF